MKLKKFISKFFKKDLPEKNYEYIDITIEDIRKAVRTFSLEKNKGIPLSIIVNEDNSINYDFLRMYLEGIPTTKFYMSKETYEIFEEKDKDIPPIMDRVQKAVDRYIEDKKELPIVDYDPYKKVSYYKLHEYIKERPNIQFYITKYDNLISTKKPS